jgi:PPOX class probable F420-dependent enzyme
MSQTQSIFEPFVKQKTVRLTTFKSDGTPVGTAVNVAVEGDHAFFRTYATAGKAKRLRNNPMVELAPSNARGVATGPALRAHARLLDGAEADHARELINRKHPYFQGWFVQLGHRLRRLQTVHYELSPVEG